jgi:hypothetical protein
MICKEKKMKIRKSENTTTQESQESQNTTKGPKGAGTSPRVVNSSADSIEMTSSVKGKDETSGKRELTTDEQAKVPNIDPENFTSLRSGADPRAALEGARSKYKPSSPQHGTGTLPNGLSGLDRSQYNVQTSGAPPTSLKESAGQIGSRAEQLKAAGGNNMTDMFNDPFADDKNRGQEARNAMGNHGDDEKTWGEKAAEYSRKAGEFALKVVAKKTHVNPPGGGEVMTMLKGPEIVESVTGDSKDLLNGFIAILTGKRSGDDQKPQVDLEDVPPDVDGGGYTGTGGGKLRGEEVLPEALRTRNILQGATGKGPGGGEVVYPSPENTGGGKAEVDEHGAFKARLGYDNSHYLIGQPAREEEKGFNGLSGVDPSDPFSGGVSDAEWTGPTRTEEPGNVRTTPTGGDGQLSHLVNNEDEDDRK